MANQEQRHCCSDNCKIENLVLDDGRKAERHISLNADGNEVIEVFVEEKRPLKLEKRIIREYKQIVAKETHQVINDGTISAVEVKSVEPIQPLQIHENMTNGFVRREELQSLISESIASGIEALMVNDTIAEQPALSAQAIVEMNVEEKRKSRTVINVIMVLILAAQLAFAGYIFYGM